MGVVYNEVLDPENILTKDFEAIAKFNDGLKAPKKNYL